jgi:GNAT superfamily N-acetyltransferase
MTIQVRPAEYRDVETMRELYREELNCQIIRDSFISRGLADPYLIFVDGRVSGYGAVSNKYDKGRLTEFYTLPQARSLALPMFRELLNASQAAHVEAQTNNPLMLLMLYDCAKNITAENILFHDAFATHLSCPNGIFRRSAPEDAGAIFSHQHEPVGEWVIETQGIVVATGGFLCHYNPPYGDIFMEVAEPVRRQGFGSYMVQELKRVCYEAGKKPAARCGPENIGSRRTLEKAGFLPCGRLLVGAVLT